MTTGAELLAKSLVAQGVDTLFFLMAGPMHDAETAMAAHGLRMIDVRHEQAAAMMAHAYGRVMQRPGVCMGGSGPGALNLHGGLANALIDCVPVVALGGSSPLEFNGMGVFQEIDQVAAMRPVTKWAQRVYETRRIPELIATAFKHAMTGKPGPVYLDFPGDILNATVADEVVEWPNFEKSRRRSRPRGDPELTAAALQMIAGAERPIMIYGSGVLWSQAWERLQNWAERTGIPFYATPQARGCIAEDHALSFPAARSHAFKNADVVLVVGTRMTYGLTFGMPPRFNANAKFIRIDIDHEEIIANPRVEIGINGDARAVLEQFAEGLPGSGIDPERYSAWRVQLKKDDAVRANAQEARLNTDAVPIHPMRLCREVRDFMDRDAILVVDGQEILNYGRQSIPTYYPGHRLNSGTFGTMGVGMPFGVGAKIARPDKQVIVLHGDGSFGMHAMELDTAVRHKVPVIVVISLNGGWTADPKRNKVGRNLGYTRFDRVAEDLGAHGEFVETPDQIRPALERAKTAVAAGRPALVNVVTDWSARASAIHFTKHMT
jgi:thiamine pyrophosphate-dependent acetolactate synthase large subunit-like protein